MKTLITADWVAPVSSPTIESGAVVVENEKIVAVGAAATVVSEHSNASRIDFGRAVIIPGLINCHSHLELTAMRGYLEDVEHDFFAWLSKLTIARMTRMSAEDLYVSAACGTLECAAAGITCVGDASSAAINSMRAVIDCGLRGHIFQEVFGPDPQVVNESFSNLKDRLGELRALETSLVRAAVSPHSPYTVSRPLLELVSDFANAQDLPLMIHAAESRAEELFLKEAAGPFADGLRARNIDWQSPQTTSIRYLNDVGMLRNKPLLAHCIRVDQDEIDIIKSAGAGVAHCPRSNAKLGHGRAPFASFLENDLRVGVGSDSVASNNSADLLSESRFAALAARYDADTDSQVPFVSASDVLRAATLGSAQAMGIESSVGSIEVGKYADLAVVSLAGPHQEPVYDPVNTLIFSSSGRDVVMTMVAGKVIYRDGVFPALDVNQLTAKMSEIRKSIALG